MDTYAIISDGFGGFHVAVSHDDDSPGYMTSSFVTYAKAQEWIDERSAEHDAIPAPKPE
jgi:hypothetical protein